MFLSQNDGKKRKEILDLFCYFLLTLLIAVAVIQTVTTYFFMPVQVVGNSMRETLHGGDVLIVSMQKTPHRGDVVVVKRADGELLVKRVVALAGDRVWTENGTLFREREVDGTLVVEEVAEPYLSAANRGNTWANNYARTDLAPLTVSAGCVYVLGDNRMDSLDSRVYGAFSTESVVGVVPQFFIEHPKFLKFLKS